MKPRLSYFLLLALLLLAFAGCTTGRITISAGWAGPVATGDVVYVGSRDGRMLALDAATGSTKWAYPQQNDKNLGGIYGAPYLADGTLYVGSYDGKLYALNASDLNLQWEFPVDRSTLGHIVGGPTVAGGLVLFGTSEGLVRALDASTGVQRWSFKAKNQLWATPTVVDGTVYVTSLDHRVYALSLQDGKPVWPAPFEAGGAIVTSPVVAQGRVYVGSFDSHFYALDAAKGQEVWRFKGEGWFWANPVSNGKLVYAATTSGKFYALDMATGDPRWQYDLESPVIASPVMVDGRVAVASDEGFVYVLSADTGRLENAGFDVGAQIRAALGVQGDVVYVNAMDRRVWALKLIGGQRQVWPQPVDTSIKK